MSHSWVADASEISRVVVGALVVLPALVAVADPVVELELPVGAGLESLPQAVSATAAKIPATTSVLREIQRGCGIGTSARVGIVGFESAIICRAWPAPVCRTTLIKPG
ncbi:hypothetical protein [Nocardia anaemiae]|uniref:hypothetical protein n=1 Tax=Nocardia anaemiae TaxID=263910 RepID=UPI001FE1D298|nr:hypothetical protein [Nocardia anaemiae]